MLKTAIFPAPSIRTTTSRLTRAPATPIRHFHYTIYQPAQNMTSSTFKYMDPTSFDPKATAPFEKPWAKVDGPGYSFRLPEYQRNVENIRGNESNFSTETSGFAVYNHPAKEKSFTDDQAVRSGYYNEVEALLRQKLPGAVKKVVIFDHTIRRRDKNSPRQPVQQVHVDQTPRAVENRVRRHVPEAEADELLKRRHALINVWRPIQNPATDFPLAVIDYRTTSPEDFIPVDLLYPKRHDSPNDDGDDRGKEALPDPTSVTSTQGYEVKGETFAVVPSDKHRFFYMKDMTPEEVMFIKCFDSRSDWFGNEGVAHCTPHTAFFDPQTPDDAPGRQSIEVRCLVFYE